MRTDPEHFSAPGGDSGAQPQVEQLLLWSGTDRLIPLFGSPEEAMAG
jgi:hypothetical protein